MNPTPKQTNEISIINACVRQFIVKQIQPFQLARSDSLSPFGGKAWQR